MNHRPTLVSRLRPIAGLTLMGLMASACSKSEPNEAAAPDQVPVVAIERASRTNLSESVLLQAEIHPYQDILVHAKVAGYVKEIYVDIGDRVKAGDLIAVLEIPEAKDELAKAKATADRSVADAKVAKLSYDRMVLVNKNEPNLIAQQDMDDAEAKMTAATAAAEAAQAEANRDQSLVDYARITAPFDGIVTKRFADTGSLIQAGTSSSTQAMPLVELAQDSKLRICFPVPEADTPRVRDGEPVTVAVDAVNGRFKGTITRSSGMVDHATRTMTTEVDLPNPGYALKPGMYASIALPLSSGTNVTAIPLQAVSGDGIVFVVEANGTLQERKVTLGIRTADKVQVLSGVSPGEAVVTGDRSALHPGERVIPREVALASAS